MNQTQETVIRLEAEYQIKELFLQLGIQRMRKGYSYLLAATLQSFQALQDKTVSPWQYQTKSNQYVNARNVLQSAWKNCHSNPYWDRIFDGDFRTTMPQVTTFVQRTARWLQTHEVVIVSGKAYSSIRTALLEKYI